jgi:hypothetical protein
VTATLTNVTQNHTGSNWVIQGGTPASSKADPGVNATWTNTGTYTITLTTSASGHVLVATRTLTIGQTKTGCLGSPDVVSPCSTVKTITNLYNSFDSIAADGAPLFGSAPALIVSSCDGRQVELVTYQGSAFPLVDSGFGSSALNCPEGVAVDSQGNVLVVDYGQWTQFRGLTGTTSTLRNISRGGVVSPVDTSPFGSHPQNPCGVAFDAPSGDFVIVDESSVWLMGPSSGIMPVGTLSLPPSGFAKNACTLAIGPGGLRAGGLFVVEGFAPQFQIEHLTHCQLCTSSNPNPIPDLGGPKTVVSVPSSPPPSGLAVANDGSLYVATQCWIQDLKSSGAPTTVAGITGECGHSDGPVATALLGQITGLVIGSDGALYVAESGDIRRVGP